MSKISIDSLVEYKDTFVRKNLTNIPELQINLVTLPAGGALPAHNANANVRLLVLSGTLTVDLDGNVAELSVHEMAEAAEGTPMQIMNKSEGNTAFMVTKAPNPDL